MHAYNTSNGENLFPGLNLQFGRVVVIEWLAPEDAKTGTNLVQWMRCKGFDTIRNVEVIVANTANEVLSAIECVAASTSHGAAYPIIHIEAHGEDAVLPSGYVGPDGCGNLELLNWQRLSSQLTKVNIATRCNLLLVSAACWGYSAILAACEAERIPFVACVGFTSAVTEQAVLASMKEFYRRLFDAPDQLIDVVLSAERELVAAGIELESIPVLSYETVLENFRSYIASDAFHTRALNIAIRSIEFGSLPNIARFPYASARTELHTNQGCAIQAIWNKRFMIDLFPENAARFGKQVGKLIDRMLDEEFARQA